MSYIICGKVSDIASYALRLLMIDEPVEAYRQLEQLSDGELTVVANAAFDLIEHATEAMRGNGHDGTSL